MYRISSVKKVCVHMQHLLRIKTNFFEIPNLSNSPSNIIKVKQSRYRPGGGPVGSRKLRFPDYMTTARDGGKIVNLTHRPPLPPGNAPGTHFC
jgi:hypothetical protein